MKKLRTLLLLPFITVMTIAILMPACTGNKNKSKSNDISINESELNKDQAIQEVTEYPLPTAFEVTNLLIEAGAGYIFDLCNPVENADKYITMQSKALNLGVYGADLSYAATYNQSQETMQYMKVTSRLIDELQVSSGFNRELADRVEESIDNVDSLIVIISDSFYSTYKHLQENNQDVLSVMVLTGSWVEALYITSQIAQFSESNDKLVRIIAQQNPSLTKLLEIMKPVKDEEMIGKLFTKLQQIKDLLDDAGGKVLTPDQLNQVSTIAESIRTEIVS